MQIIPVLDLSKGLVVHAKKGDRVNYKPIHSPLCSSFDPVEIINCFLDLYNFKSIYIADLDALQNQGNNIGVIESICRQYPGLEVWLDTGFDLISHYLEDLQYSPIRPILSTESIDSITSFTSIINNYSTHNFILSLDYLLDNILGLDILNQTSSSLPTDILVLNLDSVGSYQGIDMPTQFNQQLLENNHNLFYGGGIRNIEDLNKLKAAGFTGALISSAIHSGDITSDDLRAISQ